MRWPLVCFYCLCDFVCIFYYFFLFIATVSFAGYFLVRSLLSAFSDFISERISGLIWFGGSVYLVTTAGFVVVVVVVVVFTLKAVPVSTQYFLTSVLVQLTRTPSVVTG